MSEPRVVEAAGRRELRLEAPGGGGHVAMTALLRLTLASGEALDVPIAAVEAGSRLRLAGSVGGWRAEATWRRATDLASAYDVALEVSHAGPRPVDATARLRLELAGPGPPTWLIPGLFYGENRLSANRRIYPRWDPAGGDAAALVSDSWSFRSDRAALPAVFAWNDALMAAIAADADGPLGLAGIGFVGRPGETAIWLDFPYREEPVAYAAPGEVRPTELTWRRWRPGETVRLAVTVHLAGPDRHAYDPFLRAMERRRRAEHRTRPWMAPGRAAELAADALVRWHYRPEHAVLYETVAFDRELSGRRGLGDRPHMHVAWVSGAPYAHALLAYGRVRPAPECVAAGVAVLDRIAGGIAPCGAFWAEWRVDRGWGTGWNPHPDWLQARTAAEATLFMLRALAAERRRGVDHPTWEAAVRSNLGFAVGRQRPDGNFGTYYHARSGRVEEWDGAAGILWIAALAEAAAELGEPAWQAAAQRAAGHYARFVREELIYGAPEDVHLTPTSEDGYNAVIAFVALHALDADPRWLELARRAADWMLTFRWTYNVSFSPETILGAYDFRTRGADQASPSNQHLHNFGLICLPEMLRLWQETGDDYYLERTRDNLACALQFIARRDGDFNAYRGMASERYYQTDCFQAKGMLLSLSHAWSVGVVLYAALAAQGAPEAFGPDWPPGISAEA